MRLLKIILACWNLETEAWRRGVFVCGRVIGVIVGRFGVYPSACSWFWRICVFLACMQFPVFNHVSSKIGADLFGVYASPCRCHRTQYTPIQRWTVALFREVPLSRNDGLVHFATNLRLFQRMSGKKMDAAQRPTNTWIMLVDVVGCSFTLTKLR